MTLKEVKTKKTIALNLSDILIFIGGLAHSGASYLRENYRLHCQLLVKGKHYMDNITDSVNIQQYYCEYNPRHCYDTKKKSKIIYDPALIILERKNFY